jgi:hypothetical protein
LWRPQGTPSHPKGVGRHLRIPSTNATMAIIPEHPAKKSDRQFAGNRIMLNAIRTGFTFRFREW